MNEILVTDFTIIFLIFLRILFAMITAPIYGHKSIPPIMKVFIAFIIAYIIFTTLNKDNIVIEYNLGWLALNALKEILIGLVIGFTLNLVFHGISFAGSLIGFQVGLAMATIFNPVDETSSNVLGQVIYFLALLIFFIINGHHYIIQALASSMAVVPLGADAITGNVLELLVKYSSAVFIIAIKISAPILVSFFLIQIGEGILAKIIPQMQVFFVTYPLKLGLGILMLTFLIPLYVQVIKNLLYEFENKMYLLVYAIGN